MTPQRDRLRQSRRSRLGEDPPNRRHGKGQIEADHPPKQQRAPLHPLYVFLGGQLCLHSLGEGHLLRLGKDNTGSGSGTGRAALPLGAGSLPVGRAFLISPGTNYLLQVQSNIDTLRTISNVGSERISEDSTPPETTRLGIEQFVGSKSTMPNRTWHGMYCGNHTLFIYIAVYTNRRLGFELTCFVTQQTANRER